MRRGEPGSVCLTGCKVFACKGGGGGREGRRRRAALKRFGKEGNGFSAVACGDEEALLGRRSWYAVFEETLFRKAPRFDFASLMLVEIPCLCLDLFLSSSIS